MNMKDAVISGYRKTFRKQGRATRSEFWYFFLWFLILEIAGRVIHDVFMAHANPSHPGLAALFVGMVWSLVVLLSAYSLMAVQIRRLHDVGRSGWWVAGSLMVSVVTEGVAAWEAIMAIKTHTLFPFLRSLGAGDHIGLLAGLVAMLGIGLTIFIFSVLPSQPQENAYGPSAIGNTP